MTQLAVTHNDHVLYGLLIGDGGLGILNLTEMCDLCYNVSRSCTDVIVQSLNGLQPNTIENHITPVNKEQADLRRKRADFEDAVNDI